jgi:hypothetical protein
VRAGFTKPGDVVVLLGSGTALKNWNKTQARVLETSGNDFPFWSTEVSIPVGDTISYKFAVRCARGLLSWESGENRNAVIPDAYDHLLSCEFGDHTIPESENEKASETEETPTTAAVGTEKASPDSAAKVMPQYPDSSAKVMPQYPAFEKSTANQTGKNSPDSSAKVMLEGTSFAISAASQIESSETHTAASMSQDAVVKAFVDAEEQLSANINAVKKAAYSASGRASIEEARMKLGDGDVVGARAARANAAALFVDAEEDQSADLAALDADIAAQCERQERDRMAHKEAVELRRREEEQRKRREEEERCQEDEDRFRNMQQAHQAQLLRKQEEERKRRKEEERNMWEEIMKLFKDLERKMVAEQVEEHKKHSAREQHLKELVKSLQDKLATTTQHLATSGTQLAEMNKVKSGLEEELKEERNEREEERNESSATIALLKGQVSLLLSLLLSNPLFEDFTKKYPRARLFHRCSHRSRLICETF